MWFTDDRPRRRGGQETGTEAMLQQAEYVAKAGNVNDAVSVFAEITNLYR